MDAPNVNSLQSIDPKPVQSVPSVARPEVTAVQAAESAKVDVDPLDMVRDMEQAVEILNEALSKDPVALQFRIDETLNRPVVSVISEETGEIVHQLPQEEVIRAVKNLDTMRGILFEGLG